MSHQPTTTDFDKYTTFKITTGQTVKRTSNESHDDESKKLKLEKSGSVLSNVAGASNPATQQTTHLINSNNVIAAAAAAEMHSKKVKSRMKLHETSASTAATTTTASSSAAAGYSLIVEDATTTTGTISEESSESAGKTFTTTTATGEELMFIRKHVSNKSDTSVGSMNNEGCLEERIIHIEGDPSGNAATSYITAMSTKPPPKRLQIGMAEAKKSLGDSIDLKLITTSEGQAGGNKISMIGGDKKTEQILISASNTSINPQNTFTYSRVCSVSNVTGQPGEAVNIKSLQGAVKNPSLMVSSKKLLPEVTQTTAKVSIGNTTISVPLLKPLSSTQIIQTGGSGNSGQGGSVDGAKSVIHTIQTGGNPSQQTQLSKILNIKRGQKVTQPTYVSFSQLQIKPVSSAKIVQAKVVSKKIPLQIQAVQTNKTTLLQQTSGVVTITSTKPDPHNLQQQTTIQGHILPSPQKKQQLSFVKEIPTGAIIKTTSTANIEDASSSSTNMSNNTAGEQQGTAKAVGESTIKILEKSGQLVKTNAGGDSTNSSIIATEYLPASVKVVHTSGAQQHINASNIRTTLATQMENLEQGNTNTGIPNQQQPQQQRINICPTISIVRQNSPQLVTTSGNVSTVSLSMADAVSGQQKQLILTKSQFANVSAANVAASMGNTMTTNFPRNISLMLAKSSASQQVFTTSGSKNTLCVTTAAGNTKLASGTRLNLNIQPNLISSQTTTPTSVAANAQNESDSSSGTLAGNDTTGSAETGNSSNVQQQQQQQHTTTITQNRKIIQVLPALFNSSDGSYVKFTKTKPPQEDEDKKKGEQLQAQQQQQQNHVPQQQQQQIHMQIQQQQQQQQNHPQQIHIQQIQNTQQQQQQQHRQQLQQHRQQLLHKQQMQQIQKQQQQHQLLLNQQQQQQQQQQHQLQTQQQQSQDSINATAATTSIENNTTDSTPTTTSTSLTAASQSAAKFTLNQVHPSSSSSSSSSQFSHTNANTTTQSLINSNNDQPQQSTPIQPKAEESNNVLLKQLLQNSNTTPSNQNNNNNSRGNSVSSTAASTVLPARKVINVRAPSLGLVSSLEAQLARPVIPPVPASESSTTTPVSVSQTPPTNTSQTLKLLNDSMKTSLQHNVSAVSTTTSHSLGSVSVNSNINTNTPSLIISTTKSNLSLHSDKPKNSSSSSPLISKETSFVSKPTPPPPLPPSTSSSSSSSQPTNKEHSEQNIEIFSLQQSLHSNESAQQQQQQQQQQQHQQNKTQLESSSSSTSSSSVPVQIINNSSISGSQQSFKQFLQANAATSASANAATTNTNQNQSTLTTKITKYVQDVKKAAAEQQQQQQHQQQILQQQQQQQQHLQQQQQQQNHQMSVNRSFSTTNVSSLTKEKLSGNVILNAHPNQQQNISTSSSITTTSSSSNTTMNMNLNTNLNQGQQQQQQQQHFMGNMQQNKTFSATIEGKQADSNNQTKVMENQSTTTAPTITQQQQQQTIQQQHQQQQQNTTQSQQNQIIMQHMQQQQQAQQQQQHDQTKQTIKMEIDETPHYQQMQQVQLQQQHSQQQQQQQQAFRTSTAAPSSSSALHNTLTSPMSTTPTNSVPSTPTNEGLNTHLNLNNKQQQQQHHPQQQQMLHSNQNVANAISSSQSSGVVVGAPTSNNSTATTTISSPSLSGPNSATKDVDRKKRKRDQQKQRKQIIGNTKDTATTSSPAMASTSNAANAKKRSRKSLKLEEDYDGFIDNLLSHMRQMQPLQVLEPQLHVNYDVCNIYGWRNFNNNNSNSNSNSTSPVKESRQNERSHMFERELEGEYGAAHLPNKVPFYDFKTFLNEKTKDDSNTSSIQNNYYDQEFTSFTYKTEPEKLTSWVKVYRERAVDTPEIVSNKLLMPVDPVKTMRLNMLQQETFPGLILMSSTQQKLGRMSPVIPFVSSMALITKRKKTPLKPLENDAAANGLYNKEHLTDDLLDNKVGIKNSLNQQNVILSLPTSSAERLLDVLKNLANLLQLSTPIPYKIVDNNNAVASASVSSADIADTEIKMESSTSSLADDDKETLMKHLSLQNILNGKYKMCRHCGKAITGGRCIKNTEDFTKTKFHAKLVQPTPPRYFCNKVCYIQFRWSIEKKPSLSELKSVLESKNEEQTQEGGSAQAAAAAAKDNDLDSLLDEKDSLKSLLGTIQPTDQSTSTTTSTTDSMVVPKEEKSVETVAKPKKIPFRYFSAKCFQPSTPVKRMSEKEIRDLLFKMDITMSVTMPQSNVGEPGTHQPTIEDKRQCVLCSQIGDGVADGPSRLLNFDVDKWVHLNCALWSSEVYETISGGLVNFHLALQNGLNQSCNTCQQLGATVKCYKTRCGAVFHLPCAIRDQCVFYQNKTIHCQAHASRNDKDKELITLSVPRRVFVDRDENRQVAAIMHHSEMKNLMRVGSLIFLNVGQLLPHQLEAFHTPNYIYPIGYKIIRFYWSMHRPNKRCRYICSIAEVAGRPEFRIVVQEPSKPDVELRDITPKAVWQKVLQPVAEMRKTENLVKLYPEFISGEDLFGLTEPSIVRIIESLPGVETLTNYRFKYGRNPLLDLPLALNPSGAARTEPKLRQLMGWKKHHPQRTCSNLNSLGHQGNMSSVTAAGEVSCPYSKQFVHSKSSQYKKMKQEWRNNVYLARSKIQGLGLYAARDMERHTMIIEYIGEVIRSEVSEIREKQYEARNRGIYMFRLDEDRVVDATLSGGLARYINHSCNPNCVTEIVEVDRELRIIIFAKRRINRGEELSYDYKFDLEDEGSKIPCMCGAPNCRKWMN